LETKIIGKHGNVSIEDRAKLRNLVREYQDAIQRWRSTQQLTIKPTKEIAFWFVKLAKNLHEPNYINHEESLEGMDISVEDTESDSIKSWLQSFLPVTVAVPETQRDRQANLERKLSSINFSGQYNEYITALRRRPKKLKLTSTMTRFATFTISLMGGVSLIVPMVVLIYTTPISIKIVIISISVLAFAAMLAVFTRAKNQELLVATAAYAAVLVVFVGSSSPSQPSS